MTLKKCTACDGTGHDKPETAEERVRAFLAVHDDDTTLMDIGPEARSSLKAADLGAVLAELDRVREELTRARGAVESSERIRLAFCAEVAELLAQRPVDVEAVLVPVREVARGIAEAGKDQGRQLRVAWRDGRYADIPEHGASGLVYTWCAATIDNAIAEAEKIARGE